ncbi:uncharacterized protein LOC129590434 [Paramacrobiotus metropolitanus]|uniref:uncharacterized protein LOC129590434 n=1 Tax=Paramacrobiotus metropolitanus TaxID=2943436 RepID=UPI0024459DE2|nr:uncharacterized protein LOC129590434 [Paramacrobiotus metropolitanus]
MDISAFTDTKNFPSVNPKVTLEVYHHDLKYTIKSHPNDIGSVGYVPPRRTENPAFSYYHTPTALRKVLTTSSDAQCSSYGYDQKAKHENRRSTRTSRMQIWKEEEARSVPLLSSSAIGRFNKEDAAVDVFKFSRPQIPCIQQEFYSTTGVLPVFVTTTLQVLPGMKTASAEDEKKFYR